MAQQKHAFLIMTGTDRIARLFHGLVYAKQAFVRGDISKLWFVAEGACWPAELINSQHNCHDLYQFLLDKKVIQGVCNNCAVAFGQEETARNSCGLVTGPEQSMGQIDVLGLEDDGYRVWNF